ncbi:MAG: periplasmic heavy metal sensor [Acidobacteria bacterium]|nr:periplasmic heavy metal sensor [Acidobacteriota bacterium]
MTSLGILFIFLAGSVFAQPTRDFFPWWETPVVRDLNLNEEQTRQIQSTVREYRDRLVDLRGAVEKAENQLSDLMNEDHPDEKRLNAAIDRLVSARGELTRAFTQMGFKLRIVLTQQQWRELQKRRPRPPMPAEMKRMGPGSQGGPRPEGGAVPPPPNPPRPPGNEPPLPEAPDRGNIQNPGGGVLDSPDHR